MWLPRPRRTCLATAAVLALGGLACVAASRASRSRTEYPDPPFARVAADYPRFIPDGRVYSDADRDAVARFGRALHDRCSPEEQAAFSASQGSTYVRCRELAERVLRVHPDSIPARFALVEALNEGEANPAAALFHVRQARHLLERRGRADPGDAVSRDWYLLVLFQEVRTLWQLGRTEESLQALRSLERCYGPLPALELATIHRRRDCADRVAELLDQIARRPDFAPTQKWSLTARTLIALQKHDRKAALAAAEPVGRAVEGGTRLVALAAIGEFRWREAELALESAHGSYETVSAEAMLTPHLWLDRLGLFRLRQGRMAEAHAAYLLGQATQAARPPRDRLRERAENDRAIAVFLLALGNLEAAERFARRACESPDPATFVDGRDMELPADLVLWTVLEARGDGGRAAERLLLRRRLLKLLGERTGPNPLRPYLPGGMPMESWLLGSLVRMLPRGLALQLIREARGEETHPAAAPYFDALEAEAALADGRPSDALRLTRRALDGLPAEYEALLRGRVAAVAAEACWRLGKVDDSLALWDQALREFPAASLLLGIALPVRVRHDGTGPAAAVAAQLGRSPLFRPGPRGLSLAATAEGDQVSVELLRLDGGRHAAVSARRGGARASDEACAQFSARVLSPTLVLGPQEIASLERAAGAVRGRADVDRVLEAVRPPGAGR